MSIETRGNILASSLTLLLSAMLVFVCMAVRTEPKPRYNTVRIFLSQGTEEMSGPSEPEHEESPAPESGVSEEFVQEPPMPQEQKFTAPVSAEQSRPAAPGKPAPARENPPARTVPESPVSDTVTPYSPPVLRKSVEDLMAEQSVPKKSAEWDDSVFDRSETHSSASTEPLLNAAVSASGFEGSAVTSDVEKNSTAVSAQGSAQRETASSSGRTARALSDVASVAETQGARGIMSASASVSGGRYSMEFSDGSMRELISPDRPVIFISDDSARLMSSSQTVEVSFMVLENGRVPSISVEIRPASVLPEPVRNEIIGQVSEWIFSSDAKGNSATGRFVYTIEVR